MAATEMGETVTPALPESAQRGTRGGGDSTMPRAEARSLSVSEDGGSAVCKCPIPGQAHCDCEWPCAASEPWFCQELKSSEQHDAARPECSWLSRAQHHWVTTNGSIPHTFGRRCRHGCVTEAHSGKSAWLGASARLAGGPTSSGALDAPRRHLSAPSVAAYPTRRKELIQPASPSPTAADHASGCARAAQAYSW